MCEYDSYSEFQSYRKVTVRKQHTCSGCRRKIKPGERAAYYAGKADDFYTFYRCDVCEFLTGAPEGTAFHACDDGSDDPKFSHAHPAYVEVRRALDAGRTPDPANVWEPTWEQLRKLEDMLREPSPLIVCND